MLALIRRAAKKLPQIMRRAIPGLCLDCRKPIAKGSQRCSKCAAQISSKKRDYASIGQKVSATIKKRMAEEPEFKKEWLHKLHNKEAKKKSVAKARETTKSKRIKKIRNQTTNRLAELLANRKWVERNATLFSYFILLMYAFRRYRTRKSDGIKYKYAFSDDMNVMEVPVVPALHYKSPRPKGFKHSEETKAKQSHPKLKRAPDKRPRRPHTEEEKENLRTKSLAAWAIIKANRGEKEKDKSVRSGRLGALYGRFGITPTPFELEVKKVLDAFGIEYRQQVPMSRFIVDFLITKPKVFLEVDEHSHSKAEVRRHDEEKDRHCKAVGNVMVHLEQKDLQNDLPLTVLKGIYGSKWHDFVTASGVHCGAIDPVIPFTKASQVVV
jgi:hypothetical protein